MERTNALSVPLEVFERKIAAREGERVATEKEEYGLLCLKRPIPNEILRGLGSLAGSAAPFKTQALRRTDSDEDWLGTLTAPLLQTCTSARAGNNQQKRHAQGPLIMAGTPLESDGPKAGADRLEDSWRWLQTDVKRVANVFAEEVLGLTDELRAGLTAERQEGVDVTVKLELLGKGKCPRFHLDKVCGKR